MKYFYYNLSFGKVNEMNPLKLDTWKVIASERRPLTEKEIDKLLLELRVSLIEELKV